MRSFSPLFINSLRRIADSQMKTNAHHQGVINSKNMPKISSQKMKIGDKENSKTLSFYPKTSRNLLYSKKESHSIVKKNQNKKPKEIPLKLQPDAKRNISKQKRTEIVEIEVFMPIIDEKNNKIIYPSSKKPVIKRCFVNKNVSPKSNEPRLKNKYANKTVNEITVKNLVKSTKTKKPIESFCKSVNNPGNKADVAKTVKNALAAKKSLAKEFKPEKAASLEKRKVVSEIRYFFKENTVDFKDRPVSEMKTKRTRSNVLVKQNALVPIEGVIGILVTSDSEKNQNNCFAIECFKNQNSAKQCLDSNLSLKKTPNDNSNSNSNCSSDIEFMKENMDLLEKVEELKIRINKNCNPQENATKSIPSKIPGAKLISNNTRSNRGRNTVVKTESKSPVNRKMSSNKNDENDWRRSVYTSAKGNFFINKWRRRLENDDGLSIESWIDR